MEWVIIAAFALALALICVITQRRRLRAMNKNVESAMAQIGVQLSSRYDILITLLRLAEDYAGNAMPLLPKEMEDSRRTITAASEPQDVNAQEAVISDAYKAISKAALQHPPLGEAKAYHRLLLAAGDCEKMLSASRFTYNDSVKKFNHSLSVFPANLIGPLLGFTRKEYLSA